jgi:hypothetical protein
MDRTIKVKNENGETRIYLDGVHVGQVISWCPPASEMNLGARRIGAVRLLDGRKFDFTGWYRKDILAWVRKGEWINPAVTE